MKDRLLAMLGEVTELLATCGEPTRVSWFRDRMDILEHERVDSRKFQQAIREIRETLAGMGSFMDLSLIPAPGSPLTRQEARVKQWALADSIDQAIRDLLIDDVEGRAKPSLPA